MRVVPHTELGLVLDGEESDAPEDAADAKKAKSKRVLDRLKLVFFLITSLQQKAEVLRKPKVSRYWIVQSFRLSDNVITAKGRGAKKPKSKQVLDRAKLSFVL